MSNFSDPSNPHLVGLWDFTAGNENADTGLADGVAQDGVFFGDASATGGALQLDGDGDRFEVDGNDDVFETLTEGTIEISFTQDQQVGGSPDTLVSRGESETADTDGLLDIRVTKDGEVEVLHIMADGTSVTLTTDEDVFEPGDDVTVQYSWDENTGATLTVINGSDTYVVTDDTTGLTLDVGDDDDESFTFGAREKEDGGPFQKYFDGTIDYVAIYNVADPSADTRDFIVEGTSGADVIDIDYDGDPEGDRIDANDNETGGNEDLVDAGSGDDIVDAGEAEDTIYAGSGDDSVKGGGGGDLIFGDGSIGEANPATERESFEWDQGGDNNPGGYSDGDTVGSFTQNTGNVDVTFTVLSGGDAENTFEDTDQNVAGIDSGSETIDDNSSFESFLDDEDEEASYRLDFSEDVTNISFRINDIDGDGVVRVTAFLDGAPVEIELTAGAHLTQIDDNTVDSNGGYEDDDSFNYSVLVEIPGPVDRIVIEHSQDDDDDTAVNITDVYFDVAVDPGPEGVGDDTLIGEGGDDVIFGQTGDDSIEGNLGADTLDGGVGDDTLIGGQGSDSLIGGADDDSLVGGEGENTLDGGSGDDVLEAGSRNDTMIGGTGSDVIDAGQGDNVIDAGVIGLPDRGFPEVTISGGPLDGTVIPEVPADGDPDDDRDLVTSGAGNDVITTGDDDDTINAGNGDNRIDAGIDDDSVTSGTGNDTIILGEGSDTVSSGFGDDVIYGGLGPDFPDATNVADDGTGSFIGPDPVHDNGDDSINAGGGDDTVFGEDDDDTILGGQGSDLLDGGVDNDSILGGDQEDTIIGGQGADELFGQDDADTFIVGQTFPGFEDGIGDTIVGGEGTSTGVDDDTLDLSGAGPLRIIYEDSIDPSGTSGESGRVVFYEDEAKTIVAGELTFSEIENVIPCFTPGALIATPTGEVPVETLKEGDKVITRDNGIQEIRWAGRRTLNRDELAKAPNLRPILIKAGSLGHGLPERDMVVSPQHRVLVSGERTQLYFDESEVLVAAKHLINAGTIQRMDTLRTTYVHFMFDRHEVVLSDGAWTESFQPGDQSLGAMGRDSRDEILALFPDLTTKEGLSDYAAARRALKAHEARLLQL